jgi:vitamin B12 transporter
MGRCATAAAERRLSEAATHASVAEAAFRSRIAMRPDDVRALVGLARTLGACRIPGADIARAGELSAESIDLLKRALEIEPRHWLARYTLALNYYRAPSFLGRSGDAARQFDHLIAQQGSRNDIAEFARPFEYRGVLWERAGERDSAIAVWNRGHAIFPADTALTARLGLTTPSDSGAGRHDTTTTHGATPPDGNEAVPTRMSAVRVVASRAAAALASTPSTRTMTRSEIVTAAGTMADVLQSVQLQPGATHVAEGAELFARGGDPAETPTFIDGGRTLSVARFEGLSGSIFGAIDPWVVKSARFSSGGFSVQHGNALSGVLAIETDGRPRSTQWRAGLGLAQAGATARLPLGGRGGAWGTARATHAGALLRSHGRAGEFARTPYSVEAMGAAIAQPDPLTEYRLLGLYVRDASARIVSANGYRGPFHSEGSTHALVLSSRHVSSTRPLVLRTNAAASSRTTYWGFGVLSRMRAERSGVSRVDAEYAASSMVTLRAGLEGALLSRDDSGALPTTSSVAPGSPARPITAGDSGSWSSGGYVEGDFLIGGLRVLAGARADRLPGERELTFDPRLTVSTRVAGLTARLSAGQFHQGRWRAATAIPDAGTPSGTPRRARHLIGGVERDGPVTIRAEGFLKRYGEFGTFGAGPQVVAGSARGVDLHAQVLPGARVSGSAGYSYLDAEMKLADGRMTRSPYDVTHTLTTSATLRLARATTLGSSLRYGTGRPFTPITGAIDAGDGRLHPVYGAPTSARLPGYSRLDGRITRYFPLNRSMLVGFVELLNILDRGNVAGFVWDSGYRERRATPTFYSRRTVMVGFELQSR